MPANDTERLAIAIEANTRQFETAMKRVEQRTNQAFSRGSSNVIQFNRGMARATVEASKLDRALTRVGTASRGLEGAFLGGARGLAGPLVGALGARAVIGYADAWKRAENQLRVANVPAGDLADTMQRLFDIAQGAGADLGSTVTLFGRLSQSARELGANQEDLFRFTKGVGDALKIAGTSAEQAQGALLQLSQALGSSVVRAEEFNSINEGARPILQAVANGIAEAGGSVSRLRELVLAGKITNQEFFRGFLVGSQGLAEQADKTATTVGQSLTKLRNAFEKFAATVDKTFDFTGSLAKGLTELADVLSAPDLRKALTTPIAGKPLVDEHTADAIVFLVDKLRGAKDETVDIVGQFNDALEQLFQTDGPLISPDEERQIGEIRDLLGKGTPEAAEQARDALSRLASSNFQFTKIANQINALIDKLLELKNAAESGISGSVHVGIVPPSASDLARSAGGAAARATGERNASELLKSAGDAIRDFVNQVVQAESGGRANARNPNSTATGAGQFIESTWLDLFKRYFPDRAKGLTDATILALRADSETSRQLIEDYARENAQVLQKAGVSVDAAALHLAHFLGAGDAAKVLTAASGTPLQGLISQASINANPSILGGGKTVDDARAYAARRANIEAVREETVAVDGLTAAKARDEQASEQRILADAQSAEAASAAADAAAAAAEKLAETQAQAAEVADEFRSAAKDFLSGFVHDLIEGKSASEALSNALKNLGERLIDMALNSLISGLFGQQGGGFGGLLGSLFGGGGGGLSSGALALTGAGLFHNGGIVGHAGPRRLVPASAFAGAPRYHAGGIAGLMPGEVPSILRRGEVVLPNVPSLARGNGGVLGELRLNVQSNDSHILKLADAQIQTRAGTIIVRAVDHSQKATRQNFPGMLREAQVRSL